LLRLWGSRQERVRRAAEEIAAEMAAPVEKRGIRLLGPAPSPIPFVKRKYRYQILLKMPPRFPVGDFFPGLLRPLRDLAAVSRYLLGLPERRAEAARGLGEALGGEEFAAAVRHAGRRLVQMEEEVERANRLSERLFHALPDPVILLDRRGRVTRANRAAGALFGDDLVGRDLTGVVRHPALLDAVDVVLADGGSETAEITIAAAVERYYQCHVVATDEIGADASVLIALKDFTEMQRAERTRVDFVANASHEIRTPLATLTGCIETLQGPARDDAEAQAHFLELMAQQAARMTTLVSDLLSLSRIEINEHTPPTGRVVLPVLLERLKSALLVRAESERAEITLELEPGLAAVTGDDGELEQVFQNLLVNAVRYGGGRIELSARAVPRMPPPGPLGPAVEVRVRDHGPGIAAEHIPRLTERFYRVDTGRSRQLGGTGLGLAIVKHIVNRHRGVLQIESTPGEGSSFSVFLPAAAD
ncbi:MAG TPA: ATP-binding protein, partial [Alphaproteobacteria bacterium]|nr:ATP-binding protein [Alphaproteobacteria bacterium]